FLVIQTGTIGAACVGFGKFLGVFFPTISTNHWLWHIAHVPAFTVGPMVLGNMEIGLSTANLTGIVIVFLLAFVNIFGVKLGSMIQNVFTSAKAFSLAVLVLLAVVQVGSLFSADAWNNITFTAGEVKNPKRNIPLSLVLGTGFVLTVYFLASLAYMLVLPMHGDPNGTTVVARGIQYAAEDRVGTAA